MVFLGVYVFALSSALKTLRLKDAANFWLRWLLTQFTHKNFVVTARAVRCQ